MTEIIYWISVNEELPEYNKAVLTSNGKGGVAFSCLWSNGAWIEPMDCREVEVPKYWAEIKGPIDE